MPDKFGLAEVEYYILPSENVTMVVTFSEGFVDSIGNCDSIWKGETVVIWYGKMDGVR